MVKFVQVITTVDNEINARKIARILVGKRVAACVQISHVLSNYWWKNKIEEKNEIMCVIKGKNFKTIKEEIEKVHPYDSPEIIQIKTGKINEKYLEWLDNEVQNG
jgi:periplasmic divalent cation tolerance protein